MVPPTGYISLEAMVACLATLPSLKIFTIDFLSATSHPDQICLPPETQTVFPALTSFKFWGAYKYLEDLVTQIDGPQLNLIGIDYLDQPDDFQVTQLSKFIDSSVGPQSTPSRHVYVCFEINQVVFTLYHQANYLSWDLCPVETNISADTFDWKIPKMAQMLSQLSATLNSVIHLKLEALFKGGEYILELVDWLDRFCQFHAMKILDVSGLLAMYVAPALEDITMEMVAEVFPSLHLIFLEGEPASSVEMIVTAHALSDPPVTFIETKAELEKILKPWTGPDLHKLLGSALECSGC